MLFEISVGSRLALAKLKAEPRGTAWVDAIDASGSKVVILVSHAKTWIEESTFKACDFYVCCHPEELPKHRRRKHLFKDAAGVISYRVYTKDNAMWCEFYVK